MADIKLPPERWKLLHDHLMALQPDPAKITEEHGPLTKIELVVAVEIEGVTFLPAVYRSA